MDEAYQLETGGLQTIKPDAFYETPGSTALNR
jgi:hypothetical protein